VLGYLLISGMTAGALYALVAIGIVIAYKATRAVNFAHGDLFMLGGFTAYTAHVLWGVPYVPSLVLAVAFGFVVGALTDRIAFRPLMEQPLVAVLLATIGLSFILKGVARAVWGGRGDYLPFPPLVAPEPVLIGGFLVTPQHIVVLVGALIAIWIFGLFFRFTRVGKMMQATADNQKAAKLVGIPTGLIYMYTFAIGSAVAAAAAVLMAPITLLYPDIGFVLFIKAFAAAALGGLTSVPGAVVGGFLVGIIEALAAGYISTSLHDVAAFIVIMFVLVFMPSGLLGARAIRKV
jgi:branched-chain amino acid transport system permease protein